MKHFIDHAKILDFFFLKDNRITLKDLKHGSNKFKKEWI